MDKIKGSFDCYSQFYSVYAISRSNQVFLVDVYPSKVKK